MKTPIQNPYDNSNLISKFFFIWVFPIIRKGANSEQEFGTFYNVRKVHQSSKLGNKLEKEWEKKVKKSEGKGRHDLLKLLCQLHWKTYTVQVVLMFVIECVLKILQPTLLRVFVQSFENSEISKNDQYIYGGFFCFITIIQALLNHLSTFNLFQLALECRIAVASLIYRKILKLNRTSLVKTSPGNIINLLSNDVFQFDFAIIFLPYIVIGPIQLIILTYLLYQEVGVSSFVGIGFVVFLLPLQYFVGKYTAKFRAQLSKHSDERSKCMNEIISGIRVIKMYCWEKAFSALVQSLRTQELKAISKIAYLKSFYFGLYNCAVKPMILFTILSLVSINQELNADKIFFNIAIFNTILQTMLFCIPTGVAAVGSLRVALDRIQQYLNLEEFQSSDSASKCSYENFGFEVNDGSVPDLFKTGHGISLSNLSINLSQEKSVLRNISCNLSGNKLVVVTGPVGSGKSTLLNFMLGEFGESIGKCNINGSISYCSQEPWIFNETIRENILLNQEFHEDKYNRILLATGLREDLQKFASGDRTLVGQRGVTLSGGQKARINLARCLYKDAEIYLLDDPLSAVDPKVSKHIFLSCFKELLSGSLRVLVTHQVQYLREADYVILLNDGELLAKGTFAELHSLPEISTYLNGLQRHDGNSVQMEKPLLDGNQQTFTSNFANEHLSEHFEDSNEKMNYDKIQFRTYWTYFKSSKSVLLGTMIMCGFAINQIIITLCDWWLSSWANYEDHVDINFYPTLNNVTLIRPVYIHEEPHRTYLIVFSGLVGATILSVLTIITTFFWYSLKISSNIHNKMFQSLLRAPVTFFDQNPSGRILNRFTKDLGSIDHQLPEVLYDTIKIFTQLFGTLAIVVSSTTYYTLIPSSIMLILFYLLRRYFLRTVRNVQRIDALTRSPIFTLITSTFEGLSIIRSSNCKDNFVKQYDVLQDKNTTAYFLQTSLTRWFAIWLELVTSLYLVLVTVSFIFFPFSQLVGNVGLVLTQLTILSFSFQWGMRQSAEAENIMTGVERLLEYTNLQPEGCDKNMSAIRPKVWPTKGNIVFRDVTVSYNGNKALNKVNFEVNPGEKVGIVGRTGAGKSSIVAALFRMVEPEGEIIIDGVSTKNLDLCEVRKCISIIPQDAVLFSGTIRYNLDPFNEFDDEKVWNVLHEVSLKSKVTSLDAKVDNQGTNYSVGERQLLCLARALLRRDRILILDEATSNVDIKTDQFIQTTIQQNFDGCTILSIAHRLETVMDCDKILVLNSGLLQEYDPPSKLLRNENSTLYSMAKEFGSLRYEGLLNLATEAEKRKSTVTRL